MVVVSEKPTAFTTRECFFYLGLSAAKLYPAFDPAIRCKPSLRFVSLRFVRGFPLLSGIPSSVESLSGFYYGIG
jgi:hypothetical protein